MPVIKIEHICSASSEDSNLPAENLLDLEGYKKWACAKPGEKRAAVVLQLEKSSHIHGLDIGNNGSAFIEVLVGRSASPDAFEVLLSMSTFMTVSESKQWANANRVRMFGKEKLSKEVAAQKWDRVKVVCTQPYNKDEKYGLSFIKLISPPGSEQATPTDTPTLSDPSKSAPIKLGVFSMKKEETRNLPAGSLFFRKTATSPPPESPAPNAAAQARMASSAALRAKTPPSTDKTPPRTSVVHSGSEKKSRGDAGASRKKATPTRRDHTPATKKARVASNEGVESLPLSQLLEGVVFVLSGFKNPLRGQLREKGLEMGGSYQADWDSTSTHLICAFPNTPKFKEVKGKHGMIVKKEWILDSHAKKRRLPARKYRLGSGAGDTSSSEDERYDVREAKIFKRSEDSTPVPCQETETGGQGSEKTGGQGSDQTGGQGSDQTVEVDPYDASTDEEAGEVVRSKPRGADLADDSSEMDTEDEIERIQQQCRGAGGSSEVVMDDPYQISTDEEDVIPPDTSTGAKSLLDLPSFLSSCNCFFYGNFSTADLKMLTRYVVAYGGDVADYMGPKVTHVLTRENWDENFDQALCESSTLNFVRPQWLFACHHEQQHVPCQQYIVEPR